MPRDDAFFLRRMLDEAKVSLSFMQGRARANLDDDLMFLYGLVKAVENVGEAASQVSEGVQSHHPQIEWASIVGMRNRLVHAFFDINKDRLWGVVLDNVPILISDLEAALPQSSA